MFFVLACTLLLISCNEAGLLHKDEMKIENQWNYASPFKSSINVESTETKHDLILNIEHSEEFGFQNLYLKITTKFPDGEVISEPISLELADKKGKWQSKCRGGKCSLEFFLQEKFKFKQKGMHDFSIEQFSRKDNLDGVLAIGLKLMASK